MDSGISKCTSCEVSESQIAFLSLMLILIFPPASKMVQTYHRQKDKWDKVLQERNTNCDRSVLDVNHDNEDIGKEITKPPSVAVYEPRRRCSAVVFLLCFVLSAALAGSTGNSQTKLYESITDQCVPGGNKSKYERGETIKLPSLDCSNTSLWTCSFNGTKETNVCYVKECDDGYKIAQMKSCCCLEFTATLGGKCRNGKLNYSFSVVDKTPPDRFSDKRIFLIVSLIMISILLFLIIVFSASLIKRLVSQKLPMSQRVPFMKGI